MLNGAPPAGAFTSAAAAGQAGDDDVEDGDYAGDYGLEDGSCGGLSVGGCWTGCSGDGKDRKEVEKGRGRAEGEEGTYRCR